MVPDVHAELIGDGGECSGRLRDRESSVSRQFVAASCKSARVLANGAGRSESGGVDDRRHSTLAASAGGGPGDRGKRRKTRFGVARSHGERHVVKGLLEDLLDRGTGSPARYLVVMDGIESAGAGVQRVFG